MAIDMLPTVDTLATQLGLPSSTEHVDIDTEGRWKLGRSVWRPERTLVRSQIIGVGPTDVSQNGGSVHQDTAEFVRPLAPSPGRVKPTTLRLERFRTLAKWIGRVQRVNDDSFVALVQDQLEDRPEEEVEFPTSEVAQVDAALLKPGALFYWSVGYRDRLGGQRTRESIIRFRRLPGPSLTDIAEAEEWARGIQALVDHG